ILLFIANSLLSIFNQLKTQPWKDPMSDSLSLSPAMVCSVLWVKKGGELMGVDLLLIDESVSISSLTQISDSEYPTAQSTLMQGSIHLHHLSTFEPLLREGSMYVITGFEVTRSNHRFKMTDFNLPIRFNERTSLVQIQESFCNIPTELFRFRSHQELLSLGNTNSELPDIIGQVCTTKAYRNEATKALESMLVHLCLERYRLLLRQLLICQIFSYTQTSPHNIILSPAAGEKVRLSAFDAHATSLNQIFGTKEVGTCVVLATNINPKYFGGELYLNATAATKFYFDDEMEATRGFLQRDRVELVMDDGTTGSVFVAFDKDMVKLTNIQASQIATEQDDTHPDPGNNSTLPQQILDISVHVNLGTKSHASTTGSSSNNNANSTHAPAMKESSNQSTNLWERCHQEHINQCHRQPHPQESEAQLESYSPSPLQITHQRLFTLSISCI
ncbi:unnamed protein product, partial [Thlaspi arvense]